MRAYLLKKKIAEIYENIRKQYTVDLEQHGGSGTRSLCKVENPNTIYSWSPYTRFSASRLLHSWIQLTTDHVVLSYLLLKTICL